MTARRMRPVTRLTLVHHATVSEPLATAVAEAPSLSSPSMSSMGTEPATGPPEPSVVGSRSSSLIFMGSVPGARERALRANAVSDGSAAEPAAPRMECLGLGLGGPSDGGRLLFGGGDQLAGLVDGRFQDRLDVCGQGLDAMRAGVGRARGRARAAADFPIVGRYLLEEGVDRLLVI